LQSQAIWTANYLYTVWQTTCFRQWGFFN